MWKLLMLLFSCSVDDDLANTETATETESEETETETEEIETEVEESETEVEETETQARTPTRREREVISLRERAQKAENDHRVALEQLAEARRPAQQPQQDVEQHLWQQEEQWLSHPDRTDMERYQVNVARQARAAERNSQTALTRAEDLADKADFARYATLKPKVYDMYKDRVEERVKLARSQGYKPTRQGVLEKLMGEDFLAGKLKTTKTTTAKKVGAERGKTPGVRSDSSSSGDRSRSAIEAARKRVYGVKL